MTEDVIFTVSGCYSGVLIIHQQQRKQQYRPDSYTGQRGAGGRCQAHKTPQRRGCRSNAPTSSELWNRREFNLPLTHRICPRHQNQFYRDFNRVLCCVFFRLRDWVWVIQIQTAMQ